MTTQQGGQILPSLCGGQSILDKGKFQWHEVTETGLTFKPGTPEDYWLQRTQEGIAMFESSRDVHLKAMFIVGDCLAYGEKAFGETWSQAIDSTRKAIRLSAKTLANVQWICGSIKPAIRRPDFLTLSHHELVAKLTEKDQDLFLKMAEEEELTVAGLKKKIQEKYPPAPRESSGHKIIVDFESEEGVAHAMSACADYLEGITQGDDSINPADMSDERAKPLLEPFARIAAILARMEPGAVACARETATFLDDPDNQPLKNWADERKDRWREHLNNIAKAGRRAGLIGGAK